MPTDEERFATMRGKYPKNDMTHLTMAVGTYDTQERGSRFTLNNVHPNLDLGGGLGTGDIFAPVEETVEEEEIVVDEVEDEAPTTDGEGDDDGTGDDTATQAAEASAGDAPAVQAQAGAAEGAGEAPALGGAEGAAEPADGSPEAPSKPVTPTLTADQLPPDWESLPIGELRELATNLGIECPPTSPKVGVINRIRSLIEG